MTIDTGAHRSFIREDFAEELGTLQPLGSKEPFTMADGGIYETSRKLPATIGFKDKEFKIDLLVFEQMNSKILLGTDFSEIADMQLSIGGHVINMTSRARTQQYEVISPGMTVGPRTMGNLIEILGVQCRGHYILKLAPDLGLFSFNDYYDVVTPPYTITIVLYNTTDDPVSLPKGKRIGTLEPLSDILSVNELKETETKTDSFIINRALPQTCFRVVEEFLSKNRQIFAFDNSELGCTNAMEHTIDTGDARPLYTSPARMSQFERDMLKKDVEKMLKYKIIEPSSSPWASRCLYVPKKGENQWRLCIDYRPLNKVTRRDVHPLPRIDDTLDVLNKATIFSTLDLRSGYWQLPVSPDSQPKTAFTCHLGLYHFRTMPFGLNNAPASFSRLMNLVLQPVLYRTCVVYIDDIIVFSKDFNQHLLDLYEVFKLLAKANLKLNSEKCTFAMSEVEFLGYVVSADGIKPNPDKVRSLVASERPFTVTEVRSFLGMAVYYKRFIKDYTNLTAPLNQLLKKNNEFKWTEQCQRAFEKVKLALATSPVLCHFCPDLPVVLRTDASRYGLSVLLCHQFPDGSERIISYASRVLTPAERNYAVNELECLAIIFACLKFRPYLLGKHFEIYTDHHGLCQLMKMKEPSGRLCRWALRLMEYDFVIKYTSGKTHAPDYLSRKGPADCYAVDEDIPHVRQLGHPDEANDQVPNDDIDIRELQRTDPYISPIISKLERAENDLPDSEFIMRNGLLHKMSDEDGVLRFRLVVPDVLQNELMFAYHDLPYSGHLGQEKTYEKLKDKYYWPRMKSTIIEYVKTCRDCQSRKSPSMLTPGPMQIIPIPAVKFEVIGVDLLGPFNLSPRGNRHILVCVDHHSRYVIAEPLVDATTQTVCNALVNRVFYVYGIPKALFSDKGKCFTSAIAQELYKFFHIKHKRTSGYHPATNGAVERQNKTIAAMISMYVNKSHQDWDQYLAAVVYAYNTARHKGTRISPYELVFEREPLQVVDLVMNVTHDYVSKTKEAIKRAREAAIESLMQSQLRNKEYYDVRHPEKKYTIGQKVLVWTPFRRKGLSEKLLHCWYGPYIIVEQKGPVNYKVKLLVTHLSVGTRAQFKRRGVYINDVVHICRIKPFDVRAPDVFEEDVHKLVEDGVLEPAGNTMQSPMQSEEEPLIDLFASTETELVGGDGDRNEVQSSLPTSLSDQRIGDSLQSGQHETFAEDLGDHTESDTLVNDTMIRLVNEDICDRTLITQPREGNQERAHSELSDQEKEDEDQRKGRSNKRDDQLSLTMNILDAVLSTESPACGPNNDNNNNNNNNSIDVENNNDVSDRQPTESNSDNDSTKVQPKRKRGRPRKSSVQSAPETVNEHVNADVHGAASLNASSLPTSPIQTRYSLRSRQTPTDN